MKLFVFHMISFSINVIRNNYYKYMLLAYIFNIVNLTIINIHYQIYIYDICLLSFSANIVFIKSITGIHKTLYYIIILFKSLNNYNRINIFYLK